MSMNKDLPGWRDGDCRQAAGESRREDIQSATVGIPAVSRGSKEAFNLLRESARDGTLVLCRCRDRVTGREMLVVARAEPRTSGQRSSLFIPLAEMLGDTRDGPSSRHFDHYDCLAVMEFA